MHAGLFDERFHVAEDREFLLRLSRVGPFAYYPTVLARKREHGANATRPSQVLYCSRDQIRVLRKVRGAAAALRLSSEESAAVRQALADQVSAMQYTASTSGLRAYATTCLFLARHGFIGPLLRLRHLARAVLARAVAARHS
jgi:hypothetical protein